MVADHGTLVTHELSNPGGAYHGQLVLHCFGLMVTPTERLAERILQRRSVVRHGEVHGWFVWMLGGQVGGSDDSTNLELSSG